MGAAEGPTPASVSETPLDQPWAAGLSDVTMVPIARLLPVPSHRENLDDQHAPVLAGSKQPSVPLIVHRPSMRVIEGGHRLTAALKCGRREIEVRFFDGSPNDVLLLAVQAHIRSGLPFSLRERRAAAVHVIQSHPDWSDRASAAVTGLSAKTVGALRRSVAGSAAERSTSVGKDGRRRPINSAEGRLIASRLIADNPAASLREIAARAGISPGTVRDVRKRLARSESPIPRTRRAHPKDRDTVAASAPALREAEDTTPGPPAAEHESAGPGLRPDVSLQLTDAGRLLLRLLEAHTVDPQQWNLMADSVPKERAHLVSIIAESYAESWRKLAEKLRESAPGALRHRVDGTL